MSDRNLIEAKVYELLTSECFLNDGSFAAIIKDDETQKAINELLFELTKQDVTGQRGSIKAQVEKIVELIKIDAWALAENLV